MLCLLTGLPGSGGWRRQYPPCYLGECVNDATTGENNYSKETEDCISSGDDMRIISNLFLTCMCNG